MLQKGTDFCQFCIDDFDYDIFILGTQPLLTCNPVSPALSGQTPATILNHHKLIIL